DLSAKEWTALLAKKIRAVEMRAAAERLRTGTRALGPRGVLAQRWTSKPKTPEPRRQLNPRIASKNLWRRAEALLRNKHFVAAYRAARALMREAAQPIFPSGTYWLRRFAAVVCKDDECAEVGAA
ncbi:MAG TPA: hypothetical protein VLC09_21935, partial [Polyangiaceae bacterium]|nr:hypothetical protein [Polyangiaceae bacterium]